MRYFERHAVIYSTKTCSLTMKQHVEKKNLLIRMQFKRRRRRRIMIKISNVNAVIEDKGKRKWNNVSVHNILKLLFSETESGNYFSLTQFSLSEIKAGNNCQTKTSQRSSVKLFPSEADIVSTTVSLLVSKCLVWGWRFRFLSGRKNNLGPG